MTDKTVGVIKNYSRLNRRLSELMKAKGMTIQVLAKKAGVAVGTIQKLVSDPLCNPTISSIEAICDALGTSISDLIGYEDRLGTLSGRSVRILDWEEISKALTNTQELAEDNFKKCETIKTSCQVSNNAFALKMCDQSMLPLFPENAILIFDPHKIPENKNYILLQIQNNKNIIFKQLLIDEPFKYVVSINPLFKDSIIKLESTDKIIAVLVQSQMYY